MAHQEQQDFCNKIKEQYPHLFKDIYVLDVGSLDVNGNNRYLFNNCTLMGIDVAPGPNVDVVCVGHKLPMPPNTFDFVVSTECFEHDMFYDKTIKHVVDLLKPGGAFLFTCATTGRPEHGTRRSSPQDAPLLPDQGEWSDYYKNLTEEDIRQVIDIDQTFKDYFFEVNDKSFDLYFFGIKK